MAGRVIVPRYVDGVDYRCVVPHAGVHDAPDGAAVSELLYGERFRVFDAVIGAAWGQCIDDGYVGWVATAALVRSAGGAASHRVAVPAAPVVAAPDVKARVVATLPLNACLVAEPASDSHLAAGGGFVHRAHLRPLASPLDDPAAVAAGFVATPYVWGGRTRDGIDCSGLTQAALRACGIACPRDSDQQAAAFAAIDPARRRRGDLVVFPGHIGILTDPATLLHATAHAMTTLSEPLAAVAARLAPSGVHRPSLGAASSC